MKYVDITQKEQATRDLESIRDGLSQNIPDIVDFLKKFDEEVK